jgi:zinc transporter 1
MAFVTLSPSTWPLLRSLTKEQRIIAVICIALAFFITEIAIGFRNRSLALIADAFHIFSDLIGYVVALVANRMGTTDKIRPKQYSFGYQRASILGGFFNGGEWVVPAPSTLCCG